MGKTFLSLVLGLMVFMWPVLLLGLEPGAKIITGVGNVGTGTVTSVASGCALKGGPITTTGTLDSEHLVNAQTGTTYTILAADCGKHILHGNAAAVAVTLDQAGASFPDGWYVYYINTGAGTITITPTISTIDGETDVSLITGQSALIFSDGTNYRTTGIAINVEVDTLQTVFDEGDGITDGVTESKPFALYEDNTDQEGLKFQVHSTRGNEIIGVCGGVDNACDYFRQLNAGKKWGVKDNAGTEILTLTESTGSGALTNIKLDVEATNNLITTVSEITIPFASCVGASAANSWNDTGTGDTAPTAACNDTGSIQRPSADFAGGAVNSLEFTFPLPLGWTGNIDLTIRYVTDATTPTGNVEWDISTVCRAVGEDWDASFNAIQTITDAVGSDEALNDATQTSLTTTGCAAQEDFTVKVSRDGTNDSNNDLAKALAATLTLRRIQ